MWGPMQNKWFITTGFDDITGFEGITCLALYWVPCFLWQLPVGDLCNVMCLKCCHLVWTFSHYGNSIERPAAILKLIKTNPVQVLGFMRISSCIPMLSLKCITTFSIVSAYWKVYNFNSRNAFRIHYLNTQLGDILQMGGLESFLCCKSSALDWTFLPCTARHIRKRSRMHVHVVPWDIIFQLKKEMQISFRATT